MYSGRVTVECSSNGVSHPSQDAFTYIEAVSFRVEDKTGVSGQTKPLTYDKQTDK